jgi:hypothetical protein
MRRAVERIELIRPRTPCYILLRILMCRFPMKIYPLPYSRDISEELEGCTNFCNALLYARGGSVYFITSHMFSAVLLYIPTTADISQEPVALLQPCKATLRFVAGVYTSSTRAKILSTSPQSLPPDPPTLSPTLSPNDLAHALS